MRTHIFLWLLILSPFYVFADDGMTQCQTCQATDGLFKELEKAQHTLPGLNNLLEGPLSEPLPQEKPLRVVDGGVIGKTFEIAEQSMLDLIQRRLHKMQENGKLEAEQKKIQKRVIHKIKNPDPIPNIRRATASNIILYDPTFEVEEDVYDYRGKLIHGRGTKVNPLDHLSFGEPLIFIDGRYPDQIKVALTIQAEEGGKITLIGGSPLDIGDTLNQRIYFDQGGSLIHKFHIDSVPAIVRQKGNLLEIEVIVP